MKAGRQEWVAEAGGGKGEGDGCLGERMGAGHCTTCLAACPAWLCFRFPLHHSPCLAFLLLPASPAPTLVPLSCAQAQAILKSLPSLVDIHVPPGGELTVCGDTHGQ